MNKPEALRLADSAHLGYRVGWQRQAAAELRRLHAQRDVALEVLSWVAATVTVCALAVALGVVK